MLNIALAVFSAITKRTIQYRWAFLVISILLLAGCQARSLMKSPNLYVKIETDPFVNIAPEFRNNKVDVLYVTDRNRIDRKDGSIKYGSGRSASVAYGSAIIEFGKNIAWETLVQNSRTHNRSVSIKLSTRKITELGRFAPTPIPLVEVEGKIMDDPKAKDSQMELAHRFLQELECRLALTSRKEVFVYIHGYKSPFEDGVNVIAQLWHFIGREGVPIAYSWPAGGSGPFMGYFYDRESGEFTVYHLKRFLKALARSPELKKINIIAHSRGTDIATSALRELFIEAKAIGENPRTKLKIGNVILAAPDLDLDVVTQRIAAERFFTGLDRMTIYVSKHDLTIGTAEWLFASKRRLGQLRPEDLTPNMRESLKHIRRTHIVDTKVKADFAGHYYFYQSPAVSSDIILLLRSNLDPGIENGRPLLKVDVNYWKLSDNYPNAPHQPK